MNRREFVKKAGIAGAGLAAAPGLITGCSSEPWFQISLAQWSLHREHFSKRLKLLDFPSKAKQTFGITAVEYVSTFFEGWEIDDKYVAELKRITDYHGITNVLIMVDGEGSLGAADKKERAEAVKNHHKWVEVAKFLGCHSIRVNARGSGSADELKLTAADGLRSLSEFAKTQDMGVIVENHGGLSSNGAWLASVMEEVGMDNCGTLPDFGNFKISETEEYDRYLGVKELMPYAKGVSAKSHDFDSDGNESNTDYDKMMKIVKKSGYRGHIGIEYEGNNHSEDEGIMLTKRLLEKYF
ncbi:MAG: sugar phosphate isomerase/epimerase [Bacteroidetes bacterium]|jgi:sugar phosphate isomerase/epimerase|nr:sugar phosphate isomerase/epimerase [Bacteroidota bacterium]MBT3748779.1 sugar phosphate isomerase/epimerase [Bacteroidota bacterium]MBT4399020.1 sugar phosphate isomerase/epimerase [Bacteroidota bacterium]MBT4409317.1 sugar phosphate isomerase/epimerase [Bacteroidota bacterium]MBT7092944.1 sugar phosphate isomerase/epimerase [Bacteroidota bacterium]